ncbi:hypothetical protein DH2020_005249 [Rehmannia glutinosa]|uniref:Uncharacterized protein n=1 Tax=Rehmannia glutinosa TaxID=99300 RepID=A0ABR0XFD1_REHGL
MAYAAVILLMRNLEEILLPDSYPIHLKKDQIEYLQKEFSLFLKLFLKDSQESEYDLEVVEKLEIKIRDLAHKVTDFIDAQLYICNARPALLPERDLGLKKISLISHQSFTQIVDEIKPVKLEVVQLFENMKSDGKTIPAPQDLTPSSSNSPQDLTPSSSNTENKLVGIDTDIEELLERLSGPSLHRLVIPIVGMGGIGKTTLAERIYNHEYVIYYFHIRAWITIPLAHTMTLAGRTREMFVGLLKCFTSITDDFHKMNNENLGIKLYKTLKGMKYLVVLDDMWQNQDWDILKIFLPDDKNGSRIILTSRLRNVCVHVNPKSSPHCMHFLKAADSWELLESKLFPKERCPRELIEIGKRIAVKCQGLPLAIVVVAGILNNMDKTSESWTKIAGSVESIVANYPECYINILALSYNYLPNSLKACFLYVGAFPREYEIPVSRLIWLWIAEGFILPVSGKLLEDVADDYLEDLVNRNLIIVGKRRSNGKIKTCHIHDLLRDMSLREAQKENFLHVIKPYAPSSLVKAIAPRHISLHSNNLHTVSMHSMPLTRTYMCYSMKQNLADLFLLEFMDQMDFKLLRVLDIELLLSNHFPIVIVDLIHLRYLALAINCELPRSIFKLQNLQTLIVDHIWEGGQYLPWEIWKMPQLRHIRLKMGCYFPHPYSRGVEDKGQLVLKNLHTLSTIIGPVSCSIQVFSCLPGLRKLKIFATESDSQTDRSSNSLTNLVCLNQLETLKCSFLYRSREHQLPRGHNFPANLKKLALSGSYLPWEDMATLAVLPKLEVLKLTSFAFDGDKWTTVEDGFVELKILLLENSDPKIWVADDFHFPKLQQLILRECHRLTEIPEGIGNILTLQMIEVQDCSFCVIQSARKIHEQQQMLGNFEVGVRITSAGN